MSKRYFEQLLSRKDQGKTFRFSFVGGGSCMHSTNQRLSKKLRLHQWQPPSQKNPNAPSRLFSYAITVGKLMTFLLIVWWDNECVLSINSLVTCRKIAQDGCNNDLYPSRDQWSRSHRNQAQVFALTQQDALAFGSMIQGVLPLCKLIANVLIESSSTYSSIALHFACKMNIELVPLENIMSLATLVKKSKLMD